MYVKALFAIEIVFRTIVPIMRLSVIMPFFAKIVMFTFQKAYLFLIRFFTFFPRLLLLFNSYFCSNDWIEVTQSLKEKFSCITKEKSYFLSPECLFNCSSLVHFSWIDLFKGSYKMYSKYHNCKSTITKFCGAVKPHVLDVFYNCWSSHIQCATFCKIMGFLVKEWVVFFSKRGKVGKRLASKLRIFIRIVTAYRDKGTVFLKKAKFVIC